nr:MAG TPA: hypothetical protein [Caudoviricetes sp.]
MNKLMIGFAALLAVVLTIGAVVTKIVWIATFGAFVLALIGLFGVTMSVAWGLLWFALKLTLGLLVLLVIGKFVSNNMKA